MEMLPLMNLFATILLVMIATGACGLITTGEVGAGCSQFQELGLDQGRARPRIGGLTEGGPG